MCAYAQALGRVTAHAVETEVPFTTARRLRRCMKKKRTARDPRVLLVGDIVRWRRRWMGIAEAVKTRGSTPTPRWPLAGRVEELMTSLLQHWQFFALGSAFFAALTATFDKVGVAKMNSDLATLIRTVVILFVTALLVTARREWERPEEIRTSGLAFLVLSGVATASRGYATSERFSSGRRHGWHRSTS
jgi:drug/metabolite transporter (DMT)-like permease